MDIKKIANGIIKNPEMYHLYFNCYLRDKDMQEKYINEEHTQSFITHLIVSKIIGHTTMLYRQNIITGKNVLTLLNHLDKKLQEKDNKETRTYLEDMMLGLAELSLNSWSRIINAIETEIEAFNANKYMMPVKEKRETKKLIKQMKRKLKIIKRAQKNAGLADFVENEMKKNLIEKGKALIAKYDDHEDVRVSINKYRAKLEELIDENDKVNEIEAILDNPQYAMKAYNYAANEAASLFMTAPNRESENAVAAMFKEFKIMENIAKMATNQKALDYFMNYHMSNKMSAQ